MYSGIPIIRTFGKKGDWLNQYTVVTSANYQEVKITVFDKGKEVPLSPGSSDR